MSRRTLTNAQWSRIEGRLPRGPVSRCAAAATTGCLWMQFCGWRDLPPEFGKWTGAHARFRRWALASVWGRRFNELRADPDLEHVLIDSTICKAHADATGGRGTQVHGIGRSRGGLTSKIHAAVDAPGLPLRLIHWLRGVGHVVADAA